MYYVYALQFLKDGNIYIGITNNLERRLPEHNSGLNRFTKLRIPFQIKKLFQEKKLDTEKSIYNLVAAENLSNNLSIRINSVLMLPDSSMAERFAVNEDVASSSLARGAISTEFLFCNSNDGTCLPGSASLLTKMLQPVCR